jgi:lipopolysaccharide transport system ATP-binding protein
MTDIAIRVENVSKRYRLGLIGGGTLRADFERWWAKVRGRPDPLLKIGQEDHGHRQDEHIWALRDVSFQVQQGETASFLTN